MIGGHATPPEKLIFCTGDKTTRAVKLSLSWLILAKFPDIPLSSGLIGLVIFLSLNPVVLQGFLGESLDFCAFFLVLFIVLENILEPLPRPRG